MRIEFDEFYYGFLCDKQSNPQDPRSGYILKKLFISRSPNGRFKGMRAVYPLQREFYRNREQKLYNSRSLIWRSSAKTALGNATVANSYNPQESAVQLGSSGNRGLANLAGVTTIEKNSGRSVMVEPRDRF